MIDGSPVRTKQDSVEEIRPRVGVNPIALDSDAQWLYFGPMHGRSMYRIGTADLRDRALAPETLGDRDERWADKPISDGISLDAAGNLYLGDQAANAIGVITPGRQYRTLVDDPRLSWVDAFSLGPDGHLYPVANQRHRTAVPNGGEDIAQPPYLVLRIRPFATGTPGR